MTFSHLYRCTYKTYTSIIGVVGIAILITYGQRPLRLTSKCSRSDDRIQFTTLFIRRYYFPLMYGVDRTSKSYQLIKTSAASVQVSFHIERQKSLFKTPNRIVSFYFYQVPRFFKAGSSLSHSTLKAVEWLANHSMIIERGDDLLAGKGVKLPPSSRR